MVSDRDPAPSPSTALDCGTDAPSSVHSEQADFQIPGLNPANILRHKDKDLHFEGHDGLRDFWKQTAATRREILQLARENRIKVKRGPVWSTFLP